jgi:hypothetical protein
MTRSHPLTPLLWATYAVAALFVLQPAVDFVANVTPLQLRNYQWRYGTIGLLSGFLLTPLLGLVLAQLAAAVLGHRAALRGLAMTAAAAALALVVACGLFSLDAIQQRANVPPEAKATFDVGSAKALFKHLTVAAVLLGSAWAAWRVSRGLAPVGPPREEPPALVRTGGA